MPDPLADYTAQALRTESPITPALQTRLQQHARLVHALLGLQTEAGELADPVKKHIYYGRPLDVVNLREEIGDCLWYLAIAADALGTTLAAEQARNLAKLRTRYPHVFTAEGAQVRDLDREREVLEGDVADNPHTLRQQLAAARAESVAMRKQLDEPFKLIADVNTAGLQLWDKLQIAKKAAAQLIVERYAARANDSLRKELANAQRELSEQGQAHSVELQQEIYGLNQQLNAALASLTGQRLNAEERDREIERLQAEIATLREQLADAQRAVSDAFSEINSLRQQLDAARAETVETRKRLNDETDRHRATNAEKIDLFQQKEWANKHNAELRGKLDAANAAVTLQRSGIERLRAFVATVRRVDEAWCEGENVVDYALGLQSALDALDAGTEPAPVADPARCPECERLRAVIDQAWQRIQQSISHADVAGLLAALAEIQSNSSATLTSSVVKESLSTEPEGGE